MADKSSRTAGNVPGKWYVNSACIGCALCAGTAPDLFSMSEDGSSAFVSRQPGTGAEIESAAQALSECPVAAIGNDG